MSALAGVLALSLCAGEVVWLDSTSKDLTRDEWAEVEQLLRPGLTRHAWELVTRSDAHAALVVQVRRVDATYFVFATPGPAAPGHGVATSRKIERSAIQRGTKALVIAQTAEELVGAALGAPLEPEPSPPVAVVTEPTPELPRLEAPSEPLPSAPRAFFSFSARPAAALDVFQGGLTTLGGGVSLAVFRGRWGAALLLTGGAVLGVTTTQGTVRGASLAVSGGPQLRLVNAERLTLTAWLCGRAQWLSAAGSAPARGLEARAGSGWAAVVLGGLELSLHLTQWLDVFGAADGGWVVRGVAFQVDDGTLLVAASGAVGSFRLGLAASW